MTAGKHFCGGKLMLDVDVVVVEMVRLLVMKEIGEKMVFFCGVCGVCCFGLASWDDIAF